MSNINPKKPIVLVISGHDPTGGAGIQADIESIASIGCHPASVITSLTAQNTKEISEIVPQNPDTFQKQIQLILEDMAIDACKIGVVGDTGLIDVICTELSDKNIPIVLDPIIRSGSGYILANEDVYRKITEMLVPMSTLITPNSIEARILTKTDDLNIAAEKLLSFGCKYVLITGTHEETKLVINTLYSINESPIKFESERLPNDYHGSGCTLSSSIAAYLALGIELNQAVENSLRFTWNCLNNAMQVGSGKKIPDRIRWRIKNN